MKKAGIILLIIQAISLIPAIIMGDNIFENGIANLIGRLSFGIVGVILIILHYKKKR